MVSAFGSGVLGALRTLGMLLMKVSRRRAWALVVLWAAGIGFLSSQQVPISEESHWVLHLSANAAHAFEFGRLALFLTLTVPREDNWPVLDRDTIGRIFLLSSLYGVLDEVHQWTVPGRTASPLDLLTDLVGVYCVLKVILYISDENATSKGLVARLLLGVLLCFLGAGFASLDAP